MKDIFGRALPQRFTSTFRTVDLSAPVPIAITPSDGAFQVPVVTTIRVEFDEDISATPNLAGLITVQGPGSLIPGTVALESNTVAVFTPAAPLTTDIVHTVRVTGAVDQVGNAGTVTHTFTFATPDTQPPAITITNPATDGAWLTSATPVLTATYVDALRGIDAASGTMDLDSSSVTAAFTETDATFTPDTALSEGLHDISISIADLVGNTQTATSTFRVDSVAPDVPVISGIANGTIVTGSFAVSVATADSTSGLATVELIRNGAIVEATLDPAVTLAHTFDVTGWAEGDHVIVATATDIAGNSSSSVQLTVTVDNEPLSLTITSPVAGSFFNQSVIVSAAPSEAVSQVEFVAGGVSIVDTDAPYEATFDVTGVAEGNLTITATGTPIVGALGSDSVTVIVDRTAPSTVVVGSVDATKIESNPRDDHRCGGRCRS